MNINESAKVTLTIGQLKRLVKESSKKSLEIKKLVEDFNRLAKEYVETMTREVNPKRTNISARAVNSGFDFYIDYFALNRWYTKSEAKNALIVFNNYALKLVDILKKLKEYYPDLEWDVKKAQGSGVTIGRELWIHRPADRGIRRIKEIFPDEFSYEWDFDEGKLVMRTI